MRIAFTIAILAVMFPASPASAWWGGGHAIITEAAILALPKDMPAFLASGHGFVSHVVYDADVIKNRGVPLCRGAEHGEHYLDVELLEGARFPDGRYEFIKLCQEKGVRPEHVGLLPYAVSEWTERLAVALAEHRKWPENEYIKSKCLVYAGYVAHYAQDLCQPLHLTVHFDGWKNEDGSVSQKGIHERVDALPETLKLTAESIAAQTVVSSPDSLMPTVREAFSTGYALLERTYKLGPQIPRPGGDAASAAVRAFGEERAAAAASLTASLYVHAWNRSKSIRLDRWLDRSTDSGPSAK